jgi:hypothetical protein
MLPIKRTLACRQALFWMMIDLPGLISLALAAIVLIAAAIVVVPILTSRSNEPKNPADIES